MPPARTLILAAAGLAWWLPLSLGTLQAMASNEDRAVVIGGWIERRLVAEEDINLLGDALRCPGWIPVQPAEPARESGLALARCMNRLPKVKP